MDQAPPITTDNYQSRWPILPKWFVIILLVITYPLGIILMWLFTIWSIKIKLFITFGPALIILFSIAYIFFSLNSQRQHLKESSAFKDNQKAITTEVTGVTDSSTWKLYKNNTLGFTLNYPKDWSYLEGGQYNEKGFQIQEVEFGLVGPSPGLLYVKKLVNSNGFDLNEYIDSVESFEKITSKTILNINGVTAIQLVGGQGIKTYIMNPKDNNIVLSIWISNNLQVRKTVKDLDKHIETYQKIIRTFQFDSR